MESTLQMLALLGLDKCYST